MLQQALNRHSQIVIPPETKFFFSFLGHSRERQVRHWQRINVDLQIDLPPPTKTIRSAVDARVWYEQMMQRYRERLGRKGIVYYGEKTPEHTGRLPRIQWLFPDAKIIFIYRDGRDVALSLSKVPWMQDDLYVNFLIWLYYYRILMRTRKETLLDLCCVRYEDLAADPAGNCGLSCNSSTCPMNPSSPKGMATAKAFPSASMPGSSVLWSRSARTAAVFGNASYLPLRSLT